jgi:hypothetical protein
MIADRKPATSESSADVLSVVYWIASIALLVLLFVSLLSR